MYRWPVPSAASYEFHLQPLCYICKFWVVKNTAAATSRTSGRGHPRLGEHPKLSSRFYDSDRRPPKSRADAVRPPHEITRVRRCRPRLSRRFRRICQRVRCHRKPPVCRHPHRRFRRRNQTPRSKPRSRRPGVLHEAAAALAPRSTLPGQVPKARLRHNVQRFSATNT